VYADELDPTLAAPAPVDPTLVDPSLVGDVGSRRSEKDSVTTNDLGRNAGKSPAGAR